LEFLNKKLKGEENIVPADNIFKKTNEN